MAWSGSGVFNRLYNWVTDRDAGTPIDATRMDAEMDGFATGIPNCIAKDGQNSPTANIDFGTYKITNLGAASAATDAAQYRQTITAAAYSDTAMTATFTRAAGNITLDLTPATSATALTSASDYVVVVDSSGNSSKRLPGKLFDTALPLTGATASHTANGTQYLAFDGSTVQTGTFPVNGLDFIQTMSSNCAVYLGSYAGDGSATSVIKPSAWTYTWNSTGNVTVTHNLGTTSYIVVATTFKDTNPTTVYLDGAIGANSFILETQRTGGTLRDIAVHFVLVKVA